MKKITDEKSNGIYYMYTYTAYPTLDSAVPHVYSIMGIYEKEEKIHRIARRIMLGRYNIDILSPSVRVYKSLTVLQYFIRGKIPHSKEEDWELYTHGHC
jgi:hypothetical protein